MMILTNRFLSAFPSGERYVVNISSILGSVFVPKYGLYSITRAARNAFMGVLGVETPNVRQFSYSPGPCDTDLLRNIPKEHRVLGGKEAITTEESIKKLMGLLKKDEFKNGSMIDYFD